MEGADALVAQDEGLGTAELEERLAALSGEAAGRVERLFAANNALETLPPALARLPALRIAYLSGNRLASLDGPLWGCAGLEVLYASVNHLARLPPAVGRLTRLRKLSLHNNELRALPRQLLALPNLQVPPRVFLRRFASPACRPVFFA